MEIENTTFGSITVDGKTYEHDVLIRLSGEVVKRKKKLSKKYYGTSHVLSKDEAKFVFERGCNQLIVGSGQMGNVRLSPEAEAYFAKKDCKVLLRPTPEAISGVQQVAFKEDRAFPRDLLKQKAARDCAIVNEADCASISSLGLIGCNCRPNVRLAPYQIGRRRAADLCCGAHAPPCKKV
jgi:hypothetical protein